eukprot:scaffold216505_cov20-Tisochrysis_lutea.AAC.1
MGGRGLRLDDLFHVTGSLAGAVCLSWDALCIPQSPNGLFVSVGKPKYRSAGRVCEAHMCMCS